ncbi:MAG: undecaprenyl-diphosphatase UppP [Anaerolineae bacterium]|nr:undecaprenyl-diphosphatase UppP [Anaerolineae bacterium]
MSFLEALILGILQGFTEFLPISSSAHLVLVPWWMGWDRPPLLFEVTVHLGTTVALISYFWEDWLTLIRAGFQVLRQRAIRTPDEKVLFLIFLSTIPGIIGGLLLEPYFEKELSDPAFTAITLYITAVLLIGSEWYTASAPGNKTMQEMTVWDSVFIGIAQAIAIIPGVSRSGSTIAAGLVRYLNRESAARFSFLMATPIILGAGAKQLLDILLGEEVQLDAGVMVLGFVSSVVVGYASIAFLLSFVRRQKLYIFAAYCILFATLSLIGIGIKDGF